MTDLLTRLESGSGSDRELDCLIAEKVLGFTHDGQPEPYRKWTERRCGSEYSGTRSVMVPAYTSSLDAALSLMESMLPGWTFTIYHDGAHVSRSDPPSIEWGRAKTPARSLCAALLRALDQEPQT